MPQNDIMVQVPVGNLMDVLLILDHLMDHKQVVAEIEANLVGAGFGEGLIGDTVAYIRDTLNGTATGPESRQNA